MWKKSRYASPGNSLSACRSGPKYPLIERTLSKDGWAAWLGVKLRAAARAKVVHMVAASSLRETHGPGSGIDSIPRAFIVPVAETVRQSKLLRCGWLSGVCGRTAVPVFLN